MRYLKYVWLAEIILIFILTLFIIGDDSNNYYLVEIGLVFILFVVTISWDVRYDNKREREMIRIHQRNMDNKRSEINEKLKRFNK